MSIGSARTFQHPEDKGSLLAWGGQGLTLVLLERWQRVSVVMLLLGVALSPARTSRTPRVSWNEPRKDPKRIME